MEGATIIAREQPLTFMACARYRIDLLRIIHSFSTVQNLSKRGLREVSDHEIISIGHSITRRIHGSVRVEAEETSTTAAPIARRGSLPHYAANEMVDLAYAYMRIIAREPTLEIRFEQPDNIVTSYGLTDYIIVRSGNIVKEINPELLNPGFLKEKREVLPRGCHSRTGTRHSLNNCGFNTGAPQQFNAVQGS